MSDIEITPAHLTAMYGVRTGANIFSRGIAILLRDVQRFDPELIEILSPRELREDIGCTDQDLTDAEGKECYFGALLTPKGKKFLKARIPALVTASLDGKGNAGEASTMQLQQEEIQAALQDELPDDPALSIPQNPR